MKKIKYLVLGVLMLVFFGVGAVRAANPLVTCSYNFYNNSNSLCLYNSHYSNSIVLSSSSFQLVVNAAQKNLTSCYYNSTNGNANLGFIGGNQFSAIIGTFSSDSTQTYSIYCTNSSFNYSNHPSILNLQVRVDLPVTAYIDFPDAPSFTNPITLPAGREYLTLTTSKIVQANSVSLQYSFDGTNWNSLPVFGSGTNWYSYIVIPSNLQSAAVYFRFSATDLEGNPAGSPWGQITSGGTFPVDTQKPTMITDLTPKSYVGKVVLDWSPASNNIDHYTIYRSTSPGVQYINAYVNVSGGDSYTDTGAIPGQTYYYRVAAVDDAGNIADLSNEVSSTSLASNSSLNASGLSPTLVGQVQNFIIQADSVLSSINSIKSSMSTQSPEEQQLFSDLGFDSELTQAISQIQSIERSANVLKLEALTSDQLSSQLNALSLKLSVAEKQIPQDITIIDNGSDSYIPSANDISQAILEFNSSIDQASLANSVAETQDYIKSSGFQVDSKYYDVQITYLDGSTDTISVVSRNILGQVEKMDNSYFIENVPKSIASSSGEINVKSGLFTVVQSDPILSFTTDTKKIVYYVEGQDGVPALKGTSLVLIKLSNQSSGSSPITGGVINLGSETATYGGIGFAVIIIVILFIYFIFLKGGNFSREEKEIMELIEDINASIRKENAQESEKLYNELRVKYKFLTAKKKKEFYEVIIDLPKKISKLKHLREVNKYG